MKRFAKKALAGALTFAMVTGSVAVANTETVEAKKVTVKKVTVSAPSGKTAYVAKGKKVKLSTTVKVTPNKSANKKVTYKSANGKIASVNSKGQVKGVKAGSTKITVVSKKNSKKKATIKVVVKKAAAKKVAISAKNAAIAVGGTKKLTAKVTPTKNVCTKVQWTTSKKKVATVTAKGVVKGVSEGTATITAKAVDGSGKKATCKVTVGAGIANVTVPTSKIVRVELSSAKSLTAANFVVQNKITPDGEYTTTEGIEKVETKDGGKTYDVVLDEVSRISSNTYVKVTIDALKTNKSKEVYVGVISGYNQNETDTTYRVKGVQNGTYSESWFLDNVPAEGKVKYSVSGLPAGLKAYVNKEGTSVTVKGKFTNTENGTVAVLTGVDEKGKTFKKNYVFYVGSEKAIYGSFLDQTVLSYMPENAATGEKASGYDFDERITNMTDAVISGGNGIYKFAATNLPANVTMDEDGYLSIARDANGNKLPVVAGTYSISVTVTDTAETPVSMIFSFTLNILDGATLTGTVKDASGAVAKGIQIYGYTKPDEYGRDQSFSAVSGADGKYKVRVLPGDYSQYLYFDTSYDNSIGNVYTTGTAVTKDFTLPLYYVTFTTGIADANAYDVDYGLMIYDVYGIHTEIYSDRDTGVLYTYLKAGIYEFSPSADEDDNVVYAYKKYNKEAVTGEGAGFIGYLGEYALTGSFVVTGNGTVGLTAKLLATPEPAPIIPDIPTPETSTVETPAIG